MQKFFALDELARAKIMTVNDAKRGASDEEE
jgi:hypothetical protein